MKNYIIGLVSITLLGVLFYYISNTPEEVSSDSQIQILSNNINIGEIPMDEGKVEIVFEFMNTGDKDIVLGKSETSCMCTQGYVTDLEGTFKSDTIKMLGHGTQTDISKIIKPNEKLELIAIFDPNAHGPNATGPISRDVYIKTSSLETPVLDFKFMGNVVKTRTKELEQTSSNIENSKELFNFEEKSFDFGVIKQSGGKVSHDFKFTYNGTEPIKITGVPTSCACTSAVVNKTELNPGDSGILTVKFNPNLHEEPKGKFFKTVNLLTDKDLKDIPEVKIWTEINLDLGVEAFELKSYHDDSEEHKENEVDYHSITALEFDNMLQNKDFFLVDTHIPEQEHIDGTDIFIPYNEIEHNLDKLPEDKNSKIVVYCRSGSMSRAAAYSLIEKGYTNVYDLVGGKIGYNEYKNELVSEDNVKIITLNAKRWYYDQKEIRVKKGEKVIIKVNNIDTLHGIAIPDMELIGDNQIEVDTSKTGDFEFRCANYCGDGHEDMVGKIIIE